MDETFEDERREDIPRHSIITDRTTHVIVDFYDEGFVYTELVPRSWLISGNKVYWPKARSVRAMIRNSHVPDPVTWQLYEAKLRFAYGMYDSSVCFPEHFHFHDDCDIYYCILNTFSYTDSFQEGIAHLKNATENTDINSDIEPLGRHKRNKVAKAVYSTDSYKRASAGSGRCSRVNENAIDDESEVHDSMDSDVEDELRMCETANRGIPSLPPPPAFLQQEENFRHTSSQFQQGNKIKESFFTVFFYVY